MEARLAAITVSLNESHRLLASCARRLGVKKQDTTSLFAATTTLLSATDQVPKQPGIKHSLPLLISMHQVVGAGVPHAGAIFVSAMPTRCLTSSLAVKDSSNHSAVVVPSLGTTEATALIPAELSLDKQLQSSIDLKFNPALGSRQTIGGFDHAVMTLTTGLISADVIDPSETLPIRQLQPLAVLNPEKRAFTMCSTKSDGVSTANHCWPLGSSSNEKNDMSWHQRLQEPCKCRTLCSFFYASSNVESQWDPGIHQKGLECFLKQDQQIHTGLALLGG
jgi:hypothetical protein